LSSRTTDLPASGIVPIFPLPNVVLFPETVLPLHVFEPRYRAMVRDAASGERRIAVALLRPGYEEEYMGSPPIHPLGTVGRIDGLRPLPDGRFLLSLVGLQRVRFEEIASDRPYRLAHTTPLPERGVDDHDPEIRRAKLDLLASQACLLRELSGGESGGVVTHENVPFAVAVNGSCANLPVDAEVRQELLALDDLRQRQIRATGLIDQVLEQVLRLKVAGNDRGDALN